MRYRQVTIALLTSLLIPTLPSRGAILGLTASPQTILSAQGAAEVAVHVQASNSGLVPANVAIWQIGLALVASPDATGLLTISSFAAPDNYLLNGLSPFGPMPVFGTMLPTSQAVFSDLAFGTPSGGIISAGETMPLLDLTISIDAAASGVFYLVALPFNDNGESASSWGDFELPLPAAFANADVGTTLEARTLATIEINSVPEPDWTCVSALTGMAWGLTFLQRRVRAR
jgi:hypothetical protein